MQKIKLVIIVPSLVIGGAENMVCQLSKAINKNRFDLLVICLSFKQNTLYEQFLFNEKIRVEFLNNKGNLSLRTAFTLWRILDKYKPNIVHTHLIACLYAFPWIYTHKSKLLHTIHSTPRYEFSTRIINLMRKLYQIGKAIPVSISNKIKVEAEELYRLPSEKIEVVYNPVDIIRFDNISNKSSKEIIFIHVARMNPNKNQKLLIKAFANTKKEVPNALLLMIGEGESRSELEILVKEFDLESSVIFTGNVDNVEYYLSISNIFVLTSHYEGLPLSILEAMAAGLPIISTNVGGIMDIVEDNGILVEDDDSQALTLAMVKLAKDKELAEKMSKVSIKLSKKYDLAKIAIEYGKLYEKYAF